MKILFVAPYVPSLIRVRSYNFVKCLVRQGHSVEVAALSSGEEDEQAAARLRQSGIPVWTVALTCCAAIVNCLRHFPTGMPTQAAFCLSAEMNRLLQRLAQSGRFDLAHVEHMRAAHFGAALTPLPVVYDAVDCLTLLQRRSLSHGTMRARAIAVLELTKTQAYEVRVARRFPRVLVTSPVDREWFLSSDPSLPVAVMPNGVDLNYFDNRDNRFGPVEEGLIVMTGKMSYHANAAAAIHLVRDIMPFVWQAYPLARVSLVGSNPPESVSRLASDRVTVTGGVPDIRPYLARARVAVCPVQVKAGTQIKILEAMAMGVPVVSSKLGLEGLGARTGIDLLIGADAREQAEAILATLCQDGLRMQIARRGRQYVESNHDWQAIVRGLSEVYHEAVGTAGMVQHRRAILSGQPA